MTSAQRIVPTHASVPCDGRAFAAMAEQAAGDTQTKMKRLSREMRNLRGKTSLPIHMASSIFVRHDADRIDKVRAMITGGILNMPSFQHFELLVWQLVVT